MSHCFHGIAPPHTPASSPAAQPLINDVGNGFADAPIELESRPSPRDDLRDERKGKGACTNSDGNYPFDPVLRPYFEYSWQPLHKGHLQGDTESEM